MDNDNKEIMSSAKFIEIFSKIDKEKPTDQELKSIQRYISENDSEYLSLQKLSRNLITNQINKTFTSSETLREKLNLGVEALRSELGYETSSTIEQLLIDEIVLEYLRKHQMQLLLTTVSTGTGTELRIIKKASELASAAQNRFNKAVQTLAKLRKEGKKLQINIATEGGRQINLQN